MDVLHHTERKQRQRLSAAAEMISSVIARSEATKQSKIFASILWIASLRSQ